MTSKRFESRAFWEAAVAVVAFGLSAGAVVLAVSASPDDQLLRATQQVLIICVPVTAGLRAADAANGAVGAALTVAGLTWSLTALGNSRTASATDRPSQRLAVFPSLLYLILIYPDGRLASGLNRTLYMTSILLVTLLFIGSALFVEAYPLEHAVGRLQARLPGQRVHGGRSRAGGHERPDHAGARHVGGGIDGGDRILVAASPRHRDTPWPPADRPGRGRRDRVCATFVAYIVVRRSGGADDTVRTLGQIWSLWIPAIAVAFFIGLVVRRMMLARVLERLSLAFARELEPHELRATLAEALDDPHADLLLPDGAPGGWRDANDVPVSAAAMAGTHHQVTTIVDGTMPVAALIHDRALAHDEELLQAVSSLVLSALRHSQVCERLADSMAPARGVPEPARPRG